MWHQNKRWTSRLVAEQAVMRERFPHFALRRQPDGHLHWQGVLEPHPGVAFLVRLEYPGRYPYREPRLWVVAPSILPGTPHVYADGSVCVHRERWDPERGTVASMVPVLCAWLVLYVRWIETGERF